MRTIICQPSLPVFLPQRTYADLLLGWTLIEPAAASSANLESDFSLTLVSRAALSDFRLSF